MKKRMMIRRIAALLLSAAVGLSLFASFGVGASAAEADGYRMKFTGGSSAGEKLHLSLEMTGQVSFGGLELLLEYDETQLTLKNHRAGDTLSGVLTTANATVPGELRVAAITVTDVTPNGEIYQADFDVADSVENGDDLQLSLVVRDVVTNDKVYGPSKGLILVDTITAGEEMEQGELPQRETVSRADPGTLPGNGGTASRTSSTTPFVDAVISAAERGNDSSDETGSGASGSTDGMSGSAGRWLWPAVIALGVAALAAVLVVLIRPGKKGESGMDKIEYQPDPAPIMPKTEEKPAEPPEDESQNG